MHEQRWSVTAEGAALMHALHQSVDDDPKILVDPIAPRLIEPDGDFYKEPWHALSAFPVRSRLGSDRCSSCAADKQKTVWRSRSAMASGST